MNQNNMAVAIYGNYPEAEAVIKELLHSGFDMKKLLIVGRNHHSDEHLVGYYDADDHMKFWGETGVFARLLKRHAEMYFRLRVFLNSRYQEISFRGHDPRRAASRGYFARHEPLGDGLVSIGIPAARVLLYETALETNKVVVIALGTETEVGRARGIIINTTPESLVEHQLPSIEAEAVAVALAH
jgi:hypothetical protein